MTVIENAAGKQRQLSEKWIKEITDKLSQKERDILKKATDSRKIRTAVAGVNKETGEIIFLPIMIEDRLY